ncbi:Short-chain dehydrogenase TIC 32, chloroplastic [Vitis vinifera]|uniref:Short-chain dehydrogenase TIC 32, chloroplastic n=1 Tax=Vitis vinifera TaxID=29760 RepID=A0A438IYX6_VITVI|nr:Short-chain dehydrogenase TIC 32, chloroplastic [Vitis vinifera]
MWLFSRKGPSGFSASSTAEEVTQGIDGTGLTAIVTEAFVICTNWHMPVLMDTVITGASSAGKEIKGAIVKEIPSPKVDVMELDLSSMASVRKFASEYNSSSLPLNLLMFNETFSSNEVRKIGILSQSIAAYMLMAKLSNILHTNELARPFKEDGVNMTANSLYPGMIVTKLFRHSNIVTGSCNHMLCGIASTGEGDTTSSLCLMDYGTKQMNTPTGPNKPPTPRRGEEKDVAFQQKGASGFSSSSTAEEVTQGIDGTGLTAIVTGVLVIYRSISGIGTETTRVLALRGVHVVMGVRNMAAGQEVKEAIVKEIPTAKVDVMELDLSSMASIRKFASEFNSSGLPLNILINNAGTTGPYMLSKDNIEMLFATNHLGHFLLTSLLLDTMKKTTQESGKEGRIVIVSSEGHRFTYRGGIRFDNINDKSGPVDLICWKTVLNPHSPPTAQNQIPILYCCCQPSLPIVSRRQSIIAGYTCVKFHSTRPLYNIDTQYSSPFAYGQSKLANVLHANELARLFKEDGVDITANSLHPGAIVTNIFRHSSILSGLVNTVGKYVLKNVQQGAATTCYVALHPQVKGVSGQYFSDCNIAKPGAQAKDPELAKKLWEFSTGLISE